MPFIPASVRRAYHPAKNVLQVAKDGGYDLSVVGHSDHSELRGRLLGDTADRISDHAHCGVLIVKLQPGRNVLQNSSDTTSPRKP
jgi:nucleotide-binding universal stress UspA family protein